MDDTNLGKNTLPGKTTGENGKRMKTDKIVVIIALILSLFGLFGLYKWQTSKKTITDLEKQVNELRVQNAELQTILDE